MNQFEVVVEAQDPCTADAAFDAWLADQGTTRQALGENLLIDHICGQAGKTLRRYRVRKGSV